MLNEPIDVLKRYPIRKKKAQKEAFRTDVLNYVKELGYDCCLEKGSSGSRNIVIGDPNNAKYLVTAHYDTPASIGLPNFLTPCNLPVYIIWQLLLVAFFCAVAIGFGVAIGMLVQSPIIGSWSAYLLYMILFLLMMVGPANKNNANDNTSGVVSVLEIARSMPKEYRDKVCFVLFDLEEAGLIGSSSYRKAHKQASDHQIILNLDCVGDGDHIIFFPTRKAKKNEEVIPLIQGLTGQYGNKFISLKKDGFYTYPSDQRHFPIGFGIAAFHKKKGLGYYVAKIHTKKDTVLEQANVYLLRDSLITLICGEAVN